jgi:hypothetical protein
MKIYASGSRKFQTGVRAGALPPVDFVNKLVPDNC